MSIRRWFYALCLVSLVPVMLNAQETDGQSKAVPQQKNESSGFKPRVIWGGSAYLNVWGEYKTLGISPTVGLLWHPKIYSGVGVTYMYSWQDNYDAHIVGGRLFTNYYLIPQAFLRAEFEYRYFFETYSSPIGDLENDFGIPMLFLGAGYRQPVEPRTFLEIYVVFDVLNDDKSPYEDYAPIVGVGISTGF